MLLAQIEDKIAAAFATDTVQFTDFLTMEEMASAVSLVEHSGLSFRFFGGATESERCLLGLSVDREIGDFPITVLCGEWDRFSELSHRDVLGSILAQKIDRKCIGDILLDKENRHFYVYVISRMSNFIMQNVDRIGRASIGWTVVKDLKQIPEMRTETVRFSVSSLRVDVVIAAIWHLSRQGAQQAIETGKVFVSHKQVMKNTQILHPGQSLVLRGKGKAIFLEEDGFSKKGKIYIKIKQYL